MNYMTTKKGLYDTHHMDAAQRAGGYRDLLIQSKSPGHLTKCGDSEQRPNKENMGVTAVAQQENLPPVAHASNTGNASSAPGKVQGEGSTAWASVHRWVSQQKLLALAWL